MNGIFAVLLGSFRAPQNRRPSGSLSNPSKTDSVTVPSILVKAGQRRAYSCCKLYPVGRDFKQPGEDIPWLLGKVILITGANSGLGKQPAREPSKHGPAQLRLPFRGPTKGQDAVEDVKKHASPENRTSFLEMAVSYLVPSEQRPGLSSTPPHNWTSSCSVPVSWAVTAKTIHFSTPKGSRQIL